LCLLLQAVAARQKESMLAQLAAADKALAAAGAEKQQLEQQLDAAVGQIGARSQAAADAQEKASRDLALLRQVRWGASCCGGGLWWWSPLERKAQEGALRGRDESAQLVALLVQPVHKQHVQKGRQTQLSNIPAVPWWHSKQAISLSSSSVERLPAEA
jgi:hypothetical protein